jgi:Flp pilus assembly protein protease CpaA
MEEFYFLLGLALLWTIFAVVQDMRKTEVANWLNFSLIGFGLVYRAYYALEKGEGMFLVSGLVGFLVFFGLAHLFYYTKAFAGGDAKLLMGFGVVLPYSNLTGLISSGIVFILLLLFLGALYSLIYSLFIVIKSKEKFSKEFASKIKGRWWIVFVFLVLGLIFFIFGSLEAGLFFEFLALIYLLYYYIMALDECMIRKVGGRDLQEGDWLEKDVRVGVRVIKKSVHGLSKEEIKLLRRARKKVLIKGGIPFTPAFLLALLTMAPFYLISEVSVFSLFSFLL